MEIVQSNEEADRYIYKNVDDDGIASGTIDDDGRIPGLQDIMIIVKENPTFSMNLSQLWMVQLVQIRTS